ncbi:aquaporin-11 [Denticeps clupeoides]|uniref:Aquaporin n=1 Tax=Denticeps clupeoides TaxID=299321 RepID=A0AAY4D807_9TELE|nr:aquaporin-11 [Denticeps clupeoides]
MEDLVVSLSLLAGIVLLCEASRRAATRLLARSDYCAYAVETISTFQLCACTHELKLLGDVGHVGPRVGLTLTYLITVVHALTFHGAVGNPSGALERAYRGSLTGGRALARICCQLAAAAAARAALPCVWAAAASDLHLRHKAQGFRCASPVRAALLRAAAVELGCAFTVHAAAARAQALQEKYRIHAVAAVITLLVYAGGSVTGAVFNPALAFSTQFPCSGNTFAEYVVVYWLGPVLGMMGSVVLFDKVLPSLSGKSTFRKDLNFNAVQKKKMK